MKKFRIVASCDPYNARFHYHRQEVIRYNGLTPVEWVMVDNLTEEEAIEELRTYAFQDFCRGDYSYEDDNSIEELKKVLEEEGCTDADFSWYKGAGFYTENIAVWLEGENSYRYDVMYYSIEEYGENN